MTAQGKRLTISNPPQFELNTYSKHAISEEAEEERIDRERQRLMVYTYLYHRSSETTPNEVVISTATQGGQYLLAC